MKNLILIRHAKSSWEAPLKDFDRSLSMKGISNAHIVSSAIAEFLPKTYIIWSSPASRAKETALIFAQNLSYPIESIQFKEDLYTFDRKQLENVIKSCDNSFESVILFGHNEAITKFVNKFGDVFIENVPTSGVVFLQFEASSWTEIEKGKTKKIIFPKDLKKV